MTHSHSKLARDPHAKRNQILLEWGGGTFPFVSNSCDSAPLETLTHPHQQVIHSISKYIQITVESHGDSFPFAGNQSALEWSCGSFPLENDEIPFKRSGNSFP